MDWAYWQQQFKLFLTEQNTADAAHDLNHVRRVVGNVRRLAVDEEAALEVVIPAAWLHDCVIVAKDHQLRSQASQLAAETAVRFLRTHHYPQTYLEAIAHAITAHSFSANIPPRTIEAKVVQDADRLDAIGAIGIARCFIVGGALNRPIYHETDPFCRQREPDDAAASVDHFYTKLLRLAGTMQTEAGKREAQARTRVMREFLAQLEAELM
ncbi:MAG: HD domain-containing protein [Anaerolineae bacterium]